MPFQYVCELCGKSFERSKCVVGKHAYCSTDCYHATQLRGKTLTCEHCGQTFYRPVSRVKRGERFCSRDCYEAANAARLIEKVCPVCGKTFTINANYDERYKVCSKICRLAFTKYTACKRCGKTFTVSEKRYARFYCSEECRRPPHYGNCLTCGKQIRVEPKDIDHQFCSFSCYRRYRGENFLEKTIRLVLESHGIAFKQEHKVGRYSIDFLLTDFNIALEIDGTYWHRDVARDVRKTAYLTQHGFTVVRLLESEIDTAENLSHFVVSRINQLASTNITVLQPTLFELPE